MSDKEGNPIRAGHRTVGILLVIGLAGAGFTRFEDRAIIGMPGSPANAMAAFVAAESSDPPETYSEPPEDSVSLRDATRAPKNRIRRVLQERDVPVAASRQILSSPDTPITDQSAQQLDRVQIIPAVEALPASETPAPTFAALSGPPLAGQGAPIFAASPAATDGGGGGGGGTPVVTPVPEPGTWLMLILGLFGIGGALRHRTALQTRRSSALAS